MSDVKTRSHILGTERDLAKRATIAWFLSPLNLFSSSITCCLEKPKFISSLISDSGYIELLALLFAPAAVAIIK